MKTRTLQNLTALFILTALWTLSALGCLPWLLYLTYTGHPCAAALVVAWWALLWVLNAWMAFGEADWPTPWTLALRLVRWLLSSDGLLPAVVLLGLTAALLVQQTLDLLCSR